MHAAGWTNSELQVNGLRKAAAYMSGPSSRDAIPPRKIANTTSKTVIEDAFFHPNSLAS